MVYHATLKPGIERYALGRKFFVSKKGLFGLASPDAKQGDRIAVLFGNDVPFIFRKYKGATVDNTSEKASPGWEVVGETYVHGIMQGEVVSKWETGAVEASKIVLR